MEESAKRKEMLQALRLEEAQVVASQPSHSSPISCLNSPTLRPTRSRRPSPGSTSTRTPHRPSLKRVGGTSAGGFSTFSPHRHLFPSVIPNSGGTRNTYDNFSHSLVNLFSLSQPPDSSSYGKPLHVSHNSPPNQLPTCARNQESPLSGRDSWNTSGSSTVHTHTSNSIFVTLCFVPGESVMRNVQNDSPRSIIGRDKGQQFSAGSNPRPSERAGRSFSSKSLARDDIESYFCNSMLEDPWYDLEPVLGNILEPMAGRECWLLESVTGKKRKDYETESSTKFSSKSSLAVFLSASLDGAISDDE